MPTLPTSLQGLPRLDHIRHHETLHEFYNQWNGITSPEDLHNFYTTWSNITPPETINVKDYGAVGDGVTSDQTAFSDTQTAAAGGGVILVPSGIYNFTSYLLLRYSNITWRGVPGATTLKNSSSQWMIQTSLSYPGIKNVTFEDIIFDGNAQTLGAFLAAYGMASNITFRRCYFKGQGGYNLFFNGINGITVENCVFHDAGKPTGQAVYIGNGCRDITIKGNKFWYMREGIICDTGTGTHPISEKWNISDNLFDGGWWFTKAQFSGSGSNVSYTSSSITDIGAAFTSIDTPYLAHVIAMPVRETGSGAGVTYDAFKITDTSADFVAAGILRGEIVRIGSVFGIVKAVEDATHLHVEGWIDQTTYEYTGTVPAAGTSYTVYGVIIGLISSYTTTVITLFDAWYNLEGTRVTPSSQTRYEVLYHRPDYHLNAEAGVYDMQISRNVFKRGWSDQCSVYGERVIITENIIEDGEDMGITLHGKWNVVANNRIYHQGAGGMFLSSQDSVIANNTCIDNQWVNSANAYLGDIIINDNRNNVSGNVCRKESGAYANYGIIIVAFDGETVANNSITDNLTSGHSQGGFRYYTNVTGVITGTHLSGNQFLDTTPISKGGTGTVTGLSVLDEWYVDNLSIARIGSDGVGPYISAGYTPIAASGLVRLPNYGNVNFRNAANNGDITGLLVDNTNLARLASDNLQATTSGGTTTLYLDNASSPKTIGAKVAIKMDKITAPSNSPANTGYLFLRDNGSGKMQIAAIFPSGAVQVLATEP